MNLIKKHFIEVFLSFPRQLFFLQIKNIESCSRKMFKSAICENIIILSNFTSEIVATHIESHLRINPNNNVFKNFPNIQTDRKRSKNHLSRKLMVKKDF